MRADASFAVPVKLWALLCVFAGVTIGGNVLLTCILTGGALLYLVLQRNFRLAASYGCFYLLLALLLALGCTGCGEKQEPVTVTIWHVYGGETESPLNDLIDTFNETVGRAQNIRVQVGSVTNTNTIHEAVLASAYGEPGATALPDMFVSYPKTVLALPDADILVDYRDYFSDAELDDFIPAFLAEGEIGGHLTVLPVAKSTEILFVDKTLFDRFAAATGATLDDLSTWEGLYRTAEAYTAWTDAQTPDTPDDGKVFFVHDYHFNYFQVGVESLGADFFDGDQVAFGPVFRRVWEPYARATLAGSVWLKSGYATEPLRTGDAVASVASSASVLYYANTVTYPDNTSEPVEIISLPCPTFAGGEKLVMQRGAGICTVRSTPERERACMTFLKWLTASKRNVDFVTQLGYMPVTQTAFANELPSAVRTLRRSAGIISSSRPALKSRCACSSRPGACSASSRATARARG